MSLDKRGNLIVRAEAFPLMVEQVFKKNNKKSLVRTMTSFKFLRENQMTAVLYNDCTDEHLIDIQVEGFAASLSGDAALCMQAGYWDMTDVPEMHFEMYRIEKVVGISLESDPNWRGGKETIMWLQTPSYWYALQDPDSSYRDVWAVVLSSWLHGTQLDGTFRRLDTRFPPPVWWPKNRKRMWTALVKHVDAAEEMEIGESESEGEEIHKGRKRKAKASDGSVRLVRGRGHGSREPRPVRKADTSAPTRPKSLRPQSLQAETDFEEMTNRLRDQAAVEDEVVDSSRTGSDGTEAEPGGAHREEDHIDTTQDMLESSPPKPGTVAPFTQVFPRASSQGEISFTRSSSQGSNKAHEPNTVQEATTHRSSVLNRSPSGEPSHAHDAGGPENSPSRRPRLAQALEQAAILPESESAAKDAVPDTTGNTNAYMHSGIGADVPAGVAPPGGTTSSRELPPLGGDGGPPVAAAAEASASRPRDSALPSGDGGGPTPQPPDKQSEDRRRRLGDTDALEQRGPRRANPHRP